MHLVAEGLFTIALYKSMTCDSDAFWQSLASARELERMDSPGQV